MTSTNQDECPFSDPKLVPHGLDGKLEFAKSGTLINIQNIVGFFRTFLRDICHFAPRSRGTRRQFSENICSEEDLRSRIFGTFIVKFLASLPLLGFSNI